MSHAALTSGGTSAASADYCCQGKRRRASLAAALHIRDAGTSRRLFQPPCLPVSALSYFLALAAKAKHKGRMLMCLRSIRVIVCLSILTAAVGAAVAASNPFVGGWELTIPGGAAGWLGVEEVGGGIQASLLWGGGSVVPLDSAKMEMGKLVVTRNNKSQRKDESGKSVTVTNIETILALLDGDTLKLTSIKARDNGPGEDRAEFTGRREPAMPPAPISRRSSLASPSNSSPARTSPAGGLPTRRRSAVGA